MSLYYKDLVSEDVLRSEQERLQAESAAAAHLIELADAQSSDLDTTLRETLKLYTKPLQTYTGGTAYERRTYNQSVFRRILIGRDGDVISAEPAPITAALEAYKPGLGQPISVGAGFDLPSVTPTRREP